MFLLGSYYSQSMNATFLDEKGQPQLLQMGCYGIGITRIVGAAIEQNHDERGMIWPEAIAPVQRRRLPDRLRPLGRPCAKPPMRFIAAWSTPASTSSSTIAASVPGRCSPTGS